MHWRVSCLLVCCLHLCASAHIVFPVCSLEYLADNSTQIVLGTVTPGTSLDPDEPPLDHVVITQVFKGTLKPMQQIEVPGVLADFPRHPPRRIPNPLPFQPDSVLLFLIDWNPWHPDTTHPENEHFQIVGGGPCFFSGDRAHACFQAMNPPPSRVLKERQNPPDHRWPMQSNVPSNPPDLTRQQIFQQLDAALYPIAERQAIFNGDPDDPALVRARCEFIKQRKFTFADVEYLEDDSVQKAAARIGRVKPFEQLDAIVMGPDPQLSYAVPIDIYLCSATGRQRLVNHFAALKPDERHLDQLSMALTDGSVVREYLAARQAAPQPTAGRDRYRFLCQLAELTAQPGRTVPFRQVLLDRLAHLQDFRQEDAIAIDPACMPDIAAAVNVLDDASNESTRVVNEQNDFKQAADALRTFSGGFVPGRKSQVAAPGIWQTAWTLFWKIYNS